jgi:hypothetical protein
MYVLPLSVLLERLNLTREQVVEDVPITIPSSLLRFLMQIVLMESDFSEDGYLDANPDLQDAVSTGVIEDPRLHYIGTGYFECRSGATPAVDEEWYLRTFPDVAAALRQGHIASATEHFEKIGINELRAPGPEYESDAVEWGTALGGANLEAAVATQTDAVSQSAEPASQTPASPVGRPRRGRAKSSRER